MEKTDLTKIDYEKTTEYIRLLTEIRFKLLGLLPVITAAAFTLISKSTPMNIIGVTILGIISTLGIMFYDQRNTELYNHAVVRAKLLEELLYNSKQEGCFQNRATRKRKFFFILMWHDRGINLIYSTCFSVWTYLLVGSVLNLNEMPSKIGKPLLYDFGYENLIKRIVPSVIVFALIYFQLTLIEKYAYSEELIKKILQDKKKNPSEIANDLNKDGVKTEWGRKWSEKTVKKILSNENYAYLKNLPQGPNRGCKSNPRNF